MTSILFAAAIVFCVLGSAAWLFVPMLQRETSLTRRRDLFLAGEGGEELKEEIFKRLFERALNINLCWGGGLFAALILLAIMEADSGVSAWRLTNGLILGIPSAVMMLLGFWHMLFFFSARTLRANRDIPTTIGALAIVCALPWALVALVIAALAIGLALFLLGQIFEAMGGTGFVLLGLLILPCLRASLGFLFPYRAWNSMKVAFSYREEPDLPPVQG